ncbi:hypothetical protein K239x_29760 [Planctomycetes bacterium K23_9]|uniref:Uncharacterized protein n=1 Tax=Stieleria marina TaxID=1930275 RepID=A0A517NV40_9BACT|nr:hypothetical protein K239x_29760 [Planctomycetes bacterium K23_9]
MIDVLVYPYGERVWANAENDRRHCEDTVSHRKRLCFARRVERNREGNATGKDRCRPQNLRRHVAWSHNHRERERESKNKHGQSEYRKTQSNTHVCSSVGERRTSPRTRERRSIAKPLGSRPSVHVMVPRDLSVSESSHESSARAVPHPATMDHAMESRLNQIRRNSEWHYHRYSIPVPIRPEQQDDH